jgi:hypothetical protein
LTFGQSPKAKVNSDPEAGITGAMLLSVRAGAGLLAGKVSAEEERVQKSWNKFGKGALPVVGFNEGSEIIAGNTQADVGEDLLGRLLCEGRWQ